MAPVLYCLNRIRRSISILSLTTHLVPDIRYSSFLLLAARFPDTVTKHAAPCNAGARLYNVAAAALRYCVADVVATRGTKGTFFKDVEDASTRI